MTIDEAIKIAEEDVAAVPQSEGYRLQLALLRFVQAWDEYRASLATLRGNAAWVKVNDARAAVDEAFKP